MVRTPFQRLRSELKLQLISPRDRYSFARWLAGTTTIFGLVCGLAFGAVLSRDPFISGSLGALAGATLAGLFIAIWWPLSGRARRRSGTET